ncbi:DUF6119 family protein [Streptomyces sp. FT1]|uniref:DUF6119 family protein n=1 Tax=Streptomyces sp. FT1 TaxID=2871486 RepID=UPI00224E3C4A|nr:DUF6119 family protein [Streptomyces sp. FT1]MCX5458815.1 TIGR04141 family sporadically distributed protein [Streptomyces sp. FT1]
MANKAPTLRFNCFLLREGLDSYEEAFRPQYRPGKPQGMKKLSDSQSAPQGCTAYLKDMSEKQPTWAKTLAPVFTELEAVLNYSNRLVIFLPAGGRVFAVCFGYGSSTLEWSYIEANFGLKFAARRFDPHAMNGVGSRRIDASARSQWVQIPANSRINDFEVELEGEFTKKLVGRLDAGIDFPDIGAVVATDSVSFKVDTDLSKVQEILSKMLETTESTTANKDLAFIDSLEPLRVKSETVKNLEKLLVDELFGERAREPHGQPLEQLPVSTLDVHVLSFAPPDDVSVENVQDFQVYRNGIEHSFELMTLEELKSALHCLPGKFGTSCLNDIKITARDTNGESVSPAKPLKHWLVFEAGNQTRRYLLTLGKWYALAEKYTEKLDQDLSQLEDVTDALQLINWDDWGERKNWEKHFNERAADGRSDLICLDRKKLYSEDGDEIEACDLLHAGGYFVHVKPYSGSQTLSHLFSQGFVSAQTIIMDSSYRSDFIEAVRSINPDLVEAASHIPPKFVTYAVAFDGKQRVPQDLPTFSKVNLRSFSKRIKMLGSTPTLARIQMTFKRENK